MEFELAGLTEGANVIAERLIEYSDVFSEETLTNLVLDCADIVIEEVQPHLPVAGPDQRLPRRRRRGVLRAVGLGKMLMKRAVDAGPNSQTAGIGFTRKGFYGLWVELGTVHAPAKPTLIPGFERKKPEIIAALGNFVTQTATSWQAGADMGSFRRIKQ